MHKFGDYIKSNSEKRDSENKQKTCFLLYQETKIHCVQVSKPTFHDTKIIFFFSILNIYTCKHKIYNHQSYIYLICLGMKKKNKKQKTKPKKQKAKKKQ